MSRLRLALAAVVTVLLCTVPLVASPAAAARVLTNGGFESGSLPPWSCPGPTGSVVTTPVHTGTKALHGAATSSDNAQCTQTVPVVSGTSYTLTADWSQLTVTFTASGSSAQIFLHGWY